MINDAATGEKQAAKGIDKSRMERRIQRLIARLFKPLDVPTKGRSRNIFDSDEPSLWRKKKKEEYPVFYGLSSVRTAIVARSRERDRYLRTINPMNFHCAALRGLPCGCSTSSGSFVSERKTRDCTCRRCLVLVTARPSYIACFLLPFFLLFYLNKHI